MQNWQRRIRGALGMGLVWAAVGAVAGGVLARVPGFATDLPLGLLFTPLGFVSGVIFSGILVAIGRRRTLESISLPRFAGLGVASGLLLAGVIGAAAVLRGQSFLSEFLLFGTPLVAASAICAAGTLALARRAERRELRLRSGPGNDAFNISGSANAAIDAGDK